MSRWPITNRQYRAFLAESKKGGSGAIAMGGDNHPVVDVTWHDAREFCDWLGKKLVGGQKGRVRLPTEAEWEFAARGKERRPYPWGEKLPSPERANYSEGGPGTTTPVDSYPQGRTPDAQVWDLAGNVWEWCEDAPRTYTEREVTDPCQDGPARVVRGGSFGFDSGALRGAYRNSSHPDSRGDNLGFRVVWSPAGGPRRP
jgi:formylglycine-generating enzyme required for sulfatase activity